MSVPTLWTGHYAGYKPVMGVPVRTSIGVPRWWTTPPLEHIRRITPYGVFGVAAAEDYEAAYIARLERAGVEALTERFAALSAQYGGRPLVLLCWERDPADCHRSMFARWWEGKTGQHVPEAGSAPEPMQLTLDMGPGR